MRIITSLIILFLSFSICLPGLSEAAEIRKYPNEVKISIHSANSSTIKVDLPYQLLNLATNQPTIIPADTIIKVENNNSKIVVSYTGFSQASVSGFKLQELSEDQKLAVFTANTPMRKGAAITYPLVKINDAGDSANWISSFTNPSTHELWYRVTNGVYTGWVRAETVQLKDVDVDSLSLATLNNGVTYRGSFLLEPSGSLVKIINYLDMEDYLKGVVPREMPASWQMEALKAQAIVARSYAAKAAALSNTTSSQVYGGYSSEHERTNTAVEETEGLVVKYNGKVIQTFFHSTSGGRTANVWDVWNSSQSTFPYLATIADIYEVSPYSNWTKTFAPSTILNSFSLPSTAKIYDIHLEATGVNGEVTGVTVSTSAGSKTIRGNENDIRKLFPLNGTTYLYSNWFTMDLIKSFLLSVQTTNGIQQITDLKDHTIQTANGQITVTDLEFQIQTANGIITEGSREVTAITLNGKGWGHRIGMSQYGAKGFAEHNWKAADIVKYYFPGTTISK